MCECKDTCAGDYTNTVVIERVDFPEHMKEYTVHLKIGIDKCIYEEIISLWDKGITTCASCCGHNMYSGSICVVETDVEKMRDLGYENDYTACTYETECCFYAHSVGRIF